MTTFYLGVHVPHWLDKAGVPLFLSHRVLRGRRKFPRAAAPWALDSGGYTELAMNGAWVTPPEEYIASVRRYRDEIGQLMFAAPQDWMTAAAAMERTGLTVHEHQARTVDNFIDLRQRAADLPFIPMLQGITPDDYLRCADMYEQRGVNLGALPLVGAGTLVKGRADYIVTRLIERGYRLHGFGVKGHGLKTFAYALTSADSMAWSFGARRAGYERERLGLPRPPCGKGGCSNCLHYALEWREQILHAIKAPQQLTFAAAGLS